MEVGSLWSLLINLILVQTFIKIKHLNCFRIRKVNWIAFSVLSTVDKSFIFYATKNMNVFVKNSSEVIS